MNNADFAYQLLHAGISIPLTSNEILLSLYLKRNPARFQNLGC